MENNIAIVINSLLMCSISWWKIKISSNWGSTEHMIISGNFETLTSFFEYFELCLRLKFPFFFPKTLKKTILCSFSCEDFLYSFHQYAILFSICKVTIFLRNFTFFSIYFFYLFLWIHFFSQYSHISLQWPSNRFLLSFSLFYLLSWFLFSSFVHSISWNCWFLVLCWWFFYYFRWICFFSRWFHLF